MADLKTLADQLVNLTVKEVSELADILKEEYGIEPAAAAVAVAAGPAAGGFAIRRNGRGAYDPAGRQAYRRRATVAYRQSEFHACASRRCAPRYQRRGRGLSAESRAHGKHDRDACDG